MSLSITLEASDESGVSNAWLQILGDCFLKLTRFASVLQDTGNQQTLIETAISGHRHGKSPSCDLAIGSPRGLQSSSQSLHCFVTVCVPPSSLNSDPRIALTSCSLSFSQPSFSKCFQIPSAHCFTSVRGTWPMAAASAPPSWYCLSSSVGPFCLDKIPKGKT